MSTATPLDPKQYVPALELLKKIDFFEGIGDNILKEILPNLLYQKFGKSNKILFQGEIANRLFIVVHGSVTISIKSKGEKLILAELSPPQYFGEISLLRPTAATATVTAAAEGTNAIIITHDVMKSVLKVKIPDIEERIQKVIDIRLAEKKKAQQDQNQDTEDSPSS